MGIKKKACNFTTKLNRINYIPELWTYAPVQFWLTQYLINKPKEFNYEETKYWGRLPSFLAHATGLFAFLFLLKKYFRTLNTNPVLPYALTALIAFSIEQRIFAALMPSYAIGLLSNCLTLWALINLQKLNQIRYQKIFLYALVIAFSIAMQYQAFLLTIAGLISLLIQQASTHELLRSLRKNLFLGLAVCFVISFLTPNILSFRNRGIMWNAGPNLEFIVTGADWIERLQSLLYLIFTKSFINVYAIFSGIELNPLEINIFGFIATIFFIFGIYFIYKNKRDNVNGFLLILFPIYFFGYFSLVLFGKLAYSPTRHFLYFLPVIAIAVGYGYIYISQLFPKRLFDFLGAIIFIIYCLASLILFGNFYETHKDRVQESDFYQLSQSSQANFLLFDGYFMEPKYMKLLENEPSFWFRPIEAYECNNFTLLIPANKKLRFLWFSREDRFNPLSGDFKNRLLDLFQRCTSTPTKQGAVKSVTKIKDLIYINDSKGMEFNRNPLMDLSYNNAILQLYEVELAFDSSAYVATLQEGIDFKKAGYPSFLKYTSGIAQLEAWGRWTDSSTNPITRIGFTDALPNKFTLRLKAITYGGNNRLPTIIRIGKVTKTVLITGDPNQTYLLDFNGINNEKTIEIIPPNPISPSSLNPHDIDTRKLGIGLVSLSII